jgi:hypothetical protein
MVYASAGSGALMAKSEIVDEFAIPVEVGPLEILQQAAAFAHHHKQTTTTVVILLMLAEMIGEFVDAGRE